MSKLQGLLFGVATLVLVAVATFYFADRAWLPALASDRTAIDSSYSVTLWITGVVFIVTNLLLAWLGWRYQDAPGAQAEYWCDDHRLEWTWTTITTLVMAAIAVSALNLWAKVQERPESAFSVEVTAQQFAWNVRYPGKDGAYGRTDFKKVDTESLNFIGLDKDDPAATDDVILPQNQLYLPLGIPVCVRLRSMDVIHSFFLPQFRVKQDAVPGMSIETCFVPKLEGDFEIACAEHCGANHYRMRGQVHVVPPASLEEKIRLAAQ